MKNKNIVLFIVVITLGVIVLCLYKNLVLKDNLNKDFSLSGKYVVTYTDKTPSDYFGNVPSTLIINSDQTFNFKYNNCDAMYSISGNYNINDNILTLLDTTSPHWQNEDITFTIVSNDEIYLNKLIGCMIDSKDYYKGYGSFKRIKKS